LMIISQQYPCPFHTGLPNRLLKNSFLENPQKSLSLRQRR
jgi:hypothetical protein